MTGETSRQQWVRETRESTIRALAHEGVPMSSGALEGNLDIGRYLPSLGFIGVRTAREISAALTWAVSEGLASPVERDPADPPGKCYTLTTKGYQYALKHPKEQ